MTLKAYYQEWNKYPEVWERKISQEDTIKLVRKLRRHFKIPTYRWGLSFNKRRGGTAYEYGIELPSKQLQSIGLTAHEVSHQLAREKYNSNVGHTKKWKKCRDKLFKYIIKKNFFENQININIDIGWRDKIKMNIAIWKTRAEEKIKERCPARKGGIHIWYNQDDTLESIQNKQCIMRCSRCEEVKHENWSNSNINWNKKLEEFKLKDTKYSLN